jgi:ribonuclease E
MLINYVPGEECRIAVVEDGKLEEFYQERASVESHVGSIFKGKVTNIEPSIQAAFVDFGLERNGFLHISDLHPMYFPGKDREEFEKVGQKTSRKDRPPIQKCLRRGQEILVQVLKEGIGTKGPTLTSYLSIPGRFIVMMPHMHRMGVSRKVDDDEARREARDLLKELDPPEGYGFIVRTAGIGQTKTDLKRDLAYLTRLWKAIETRQKKLKGVGELYTESDLIIRTLRDIFSNDINEVVVDDIAAARRAREFLQIANPRTKAKLQYYHDPVPLFHRYDIERQIDSISAREVPMDSGGYLVFDQAEALVAIDVNSGKNRAARDAESNAYNVNKEAVDEICRQLRLRDLGGVVVCDLIDMRESKNRRKIEQQFRNNLKKDRARTRINPISQFGILEMTRQRMRPSLENSLYQDCPHCAGLGVVKSAESTVLSVMRRLQLVLQRQEVHSVELTISPDVAFQLLNRKRGSLVSLEKRFGKPALVRVGGSRVDYLNIAAYDSRKSPLNVESLSSPSNLPKPIDKAYYDLLKDQLPPEEELDTEQEVDPEQALAVPSPAVLAEEEDLEEAHELQQTAPGDASKGAAEPASARGETDEEDADAAEGGGKKRRRRRRGGRGRKKKTQDAKAQDGGGEEDAADAKPEPTREPEPAKAEPKAHDDGSDESNSQGGEGGGKKRRRRRRKRRKNGGDSGDGDGGGNADAKQPQAQHPDQKPDQKAAQHEDRPGDDARPERSAAKAAHDPESKADAAPGSGYTNRIRPEVEAEAPGS